MHRLGSVTRRALLAVIVTAAVLVTTVGTAVALTPYPSNHVAQVPLSGFNTDATKIGDWYWMRSASFDDLATYRFASFDPAILSYDRKMAVMVAPLVTNGTSGGSGWSARLHVTVTYTYAGGSRVWNYHVTANNPFPIKSSLDSGGVGYQAYGKLTLTKSQFAHGPGTLRIKVSRDSAYHAFGFHPHVAVNSGAVSLWYLTP